MIVGYRAVRWMSHGGRAAHKTGACVRPSSEPGIPVGRERGFVCWTDGSTVVEPLHSWLPLARFTVFLRGSFLSAPFFALRWSRAAVSRSFTSASGLARKTRVVRLSFAVAVVALVAIAGGVVVASADGTQPPGVSDAQTFNVDETSTTVVASISPNGLDTDWQVEYGTTGEYGSVESGAMVAGSSPGASERQVT